MKKILLLAVSVFILAIGLTGCNSGGSNDAYQDGTYRAEFSDFDSHGWKGYVEITVKDKTFSNVVMDYVNEEGIKKSESEEYYVTWNSVNEDENFDPTQVFSQLQSQLLEKQDISKVDAISGATSTSSNFTALVESLESNMKSGKTDTVIIEE